MAIVFVGIALTVITTDLDSVWLCATLLIAGIGIAPALAVMFAIISSSVRFSDTAEAYGWAGTGQLIGAAIGSAIAGVLIDRSAPSAASASPPASPSSASSCPSSSSACCPTSAAPTPARSPTPSPCRSRPADPRRLACSPGRR